MRISACISVTAADVGVPMFPFFRAMTAFALLCLFLAEPAMGAMPPGWGRINMQGAIIETACAIDTGSRYQTIDMATLPFGQIIREGRGQSLAFRIHLVNCVLGRINPALPDWRRFQITFDGSPDTGGFGVSGAARGVALQITDERGYIATPGEALPAVNIMPGEMLLNYSLRLVGNQQVLRAGDYYSTVRFKLDYY